VTWGQAGAKLEKEKVYWVSTTRKDGRPHSVPVWGIWKDNAFYFETTPSTVKGRNLSQNPSIVVHTQDGYDTVIVEGRTSAEKRPAFLQTLRKMYTAKYDYTPDWSRPDGDRVYRVAPAVVHAWRAPRMHQSIVKFVF
jgi:nitroimidazol reductase NimA-like FMN-containing flavoprotein (pyridoxamine 5'-phosphate oxidase superfamily)